MFNPKYLIVLFALITASSLKVEVALAQDIPPPVTGGWFLRPVTRLQGEVFRLEQRLAKINTPLDQLQPRALALTRNMTEIRAQTAVLLEQLNSTQIDMRALQLEINTLRQPVVALREPVMRLRVPVINLEIPVTQLKDPIQKLSSQILNLEKPLKSVHTGVAALGVRFSELGNRFSELDKRFSALDGRFSELDGRFAELDGRFVELDSRFSKLDGRFAALGDQLASLQTVLFWLIVSVIAVAAVTVLLGTVLGVVFTRSITGMRSPNLSPDLRSAPGRW